MVYELLTVTVSLWDVEGSSVPRGSHSPWHQRQGEDGEMGLGLSRESGNPAPGGYLSTFLSLLWAPCSLSWLLQGPAPWSCVDQRPLPSVFSDSDQAKDHG